MNAKYFVFTLALISSSAHAMGSRGPISKSPIWACDQIIPKSESVCSTHQADVRSYYNRCVDSANLASEPDAISPVVAHQAASLVFARELDLLYRLRPVENYANEWNRFESHWQRYLSAHPAFLTVETSDALTKDARSPFLVFINNPGLYRAHAADLDRELRLRLDISPLRPASFYALGASVLLRLLQDQPASAARSEEQAWYETAYPELGRPNLNSLADLYFTKSNQSAQSVVQAIEALGRSRGEPNVSSLRFAHVLEYLDSTLDAGDKHNSYFIQWLENEFTTTASNILHELERSLNNDDYVADPLVLASVKPTLNPTRSLLAQNFWVTECEAWFNKKRWAAVAHVNNKYLGPAAQISFAALLALSGGGLIGDAGALLRQGPGVRRVFKAIARASDRALVVPSVAVFAFGIPNSVLALATSARGRNAAMREFYLSVVPLGTSSPERRAQLLSDERWAIFGVLVNLSPLGVMGWQRLARP